MNTFIQNNEILSYTIYMIGIIVILSWHNMHRFYDKKYQVSNPKLSLFHNKTWHVVLFILLAWISAPAALFLLKPSFIQLLATQVFACFLIWNIFDPVYNGFTGMKFFYRGTVAFSDTFNIPNWLYFGIKFIGLLASIVFLIILF